MTQDSLANRRITRVERYDQICRLRERGFTLRGIAEELGVSYGLVRDVYYDPDGSDSRKRKARVGRPCADCDKWLVNGGSPVPKGKRCWACHVVYMRTVEYRRGAAQRGSENLRTWSDDAMLDALRVVAIDGLLTTTMYAAAYDAAPRGSMPSLALVTNRFDKWDIAVERAGLRTRRGAIRRLDRTPTAGLLYAIEDCSRELGHLPSYNEYNEWAQRIGAPSGSLIRIRFDGSWMDAIAEAEKNQVKAA